MMQSELMGRQRQNGMALMMSLVFLLLLSLIGLSSMQSATLQEKMAGSVVSRNQSFQDAESALRRGEGAVQGNGFQLPMCADPIRCAPPAESAVVTSGGFNAHSGVTWVAAGNGFYGLQNLGVSEKAVNVPSQLPVLLYRVTAIGRAGLSRSVLESIHACWRVTEGKSSECAVISGKMLASSTNGQADIPGRRIMWRQIQ